MPPLTIAIINYPTASQSAVYGLAEAITLADAFCQTYAMPITFIPRVLTLETLDPGEPANVVVLPPCLKDDFYTSDQPALQDYLAQMQQQGAVLASACVGAFILARGGFLDHKGCTTHWRLAPAFRAAFPLVHLQEAAIIVNEGDVITAGGRMAWLDLLFEIVSQFASPAIALALSKEMVIDNGFREQRFYHQFIPKRDHGDDLVLSVQRVLDQQYINAPSVRELADRHFVSARTLQRRFMKALAMSVVHYLQKLRLHHACQWLELSDKGVNDIAYRVGYQDVSAFRKVFMREYGLTPTEFRQRFRPSSGGNEA
jgi:transcriptional regulator GlxA family with amidase domain